MYARVAAVRTPKRAELEHYCVSEAQSIRAGLRDRRRGRHVERIARVREIGAEGGEPRLPLAHRTGERLEISLPRGRTRGVRRLVAADRADVW